MTNPHTYYVHVTVGVALDASGDPMSAEVADIADEMNVYIYATGDFVQRKEIADMLNDWAATHVSHLLETAQELERNPYEANQRTEPHHHGGT